MDLMLAKSKAGHDIKQVYVVVNEDDEYLYLANGTTKLLSKPKKKKKIHTQLIKNIPSDVLDEIKDVSTLDDVKIKRILKSYNRRNEDV
ncbi:MAG: RNA-binding protein [Pseudobutyrivibrio sp.]|uniref:RNA-binding protein n=1 Tax=Pseudobutyrivibrio sp. TaxID=2014367 RepID=UPI001B1E4D24|nr:RNA-binding protein [Pseudobutyrivibrio sp.]MBO5616915.1 RNA-binding protein [Pseudobutyrivibrio sp.]MBO6283588.1 RNA-binding protein [Pseudobutyrivibrio sp.]MBP3262471.1 RNA-binding protein [Pseudobutyrivibrio sp.]